MRFQRILEVVQYRPWFITAEGYNTVSQVLDIAIRDRSVREDQPANAGPFAFFVNERPDVSIDRDGIATVHVMGVLGQKMSAFEKSCGNTGYEQIVSDVESARKDGARAFLFNFDTPGGAAVGAGEVARFISQIEEPTASFTDSLMASAGYYLGSGTNYIVASSSALVGSIGTILPWVDKSKLWSLNGVKFDPIINEGADLKGAMHGPSLTDGQREFLQQHVNDLAYQFQQHVADFREVDEEVWRAGVYIGERAAGMNLVDDIGGEQLAREFLRSQLGR